MGTLKDALGQSKPLHVGSRCSTGQLLDQLDAEDAAALREAFESNMTTPAIARALAEIGVDISVSAVARHRRKTGDTCRCEK